VPSADIWIASGPAPVSWDTPAAWSLGAAPRAGDDVIFQTDAQGSGSAPVILGHATPLLNSVTFDGSWVGTITLRADAAAQAAGQLNAHTITLEARPQPGEEVLLDPGTDVHSDTALNLSGGSITGAGIIQAEGTITVNGTSVADAPALGAYLEVGDGITPTSMTFAEQSVPLVVMADGNIDVHAGASVDFENSPTAGPMATAVISADAGPHTLALDGGTVFREGGPELLVGLGVVVNSGALEAGPTSPGSPASGALHFTGTNSDGAGLTVSGGQVSALGSLSFDAGVRIAGGQVDVVDGATLEAGTVRAPVTSFLSGSGDLRLEGTFRSHGDFVMSGGVLETMGSADSAIMLDAGDTFFLSGGTVNGSPTVSVGQFPVATAPSQPPPAAPILPAPADLVFAASGTAAPVAAMSGVTGNPPSWGVALPPASPGDITSIAALAAWAPMMPGVAPAIS
jgi:hypothetical protein